MALISTDPRSLVGRIHELIGELHANGRMSSADVSLIYALTWHHDLPPFFREERSSPLIGGEGGADLMPAMRCTAQSNIVTINVTGASDPKATGDAVARAIRQNDKAAGHR